MTGVPVPLIGPDGMITQEWGRYLIGLFSEVAPNDRVAMLEAHNASLTVELLDCLTKQVRAERERDLALNLIAELEAKLSAFTADPDDKPQAPKEPKPIPAGALNPQQGDRRRIGG